MSRNDNDYERADTGRVYGRAGIGLFDRSVRQPDEELMDAEEGRTAADEPEILLFMMRFFKWAVLPYNPARVWGVIYALDLEGFIQGRSMATVARDLDMTRASISNAAVEAAKIFGLPPSRAMRSKKTAGRSKVARVRFSRPVAQQSKKGLS